MAANDKAEARIKVRDVMKTPVFTVTDDTSIDKVAKVMADHSIGSVVIVNSKNYPIGIVTERDIVRRVVVKDVHPSNVNSKEVMSSPLFTISPDDSISVAAKRMNEIGLRRLVVMHKGELIGILSSKEIIAVTPALTELIVERAKVGKVFPKGARGSPAGYCEVCGQWSDVLVESDGEFLCEECITEHKEEE